PAGPFITAIDGHPASTRYAGNDPLIQQGARQINNPDAADAMVKDLYGAGMLGIHLVYDDRGGAVPKLDSNVVKALIEAAERRGMWVSAQASEEDDLVSLARWGVNPVFFSGAIEKPLALGPLVEQDTWLIPSTTFDQEKWISLPYAILDSLGVQVGFGSSQHHSQFRFGEAFHQAISTQMRGGRDPLKMLRAATWGAAQNLKADDRLGRIRSGFQADLLLISGEAWKAPESWQRPDWVMARGNVLVRNGQIVED
ncbi:MAG: amidohydrolase family protein, partial [Bacteroidota bacterium]